MYKIADVAHVLRIDDKDTTGQVPSLFSTWVWVKNRYPKLIPGKWKHGLKPAVPCWSNFDPYQARSFHTHPHNPGVWKLQHVRDSVSHTPMCFLWGTYLGTYFGPIATCVSLRHGASADRGQGSTPLHFAAEYGHAAVAATLLAHGANKARRVFVWRGGAEVLTGSLQNKRAFYMYMYKNIYCCLVAFVLV